MEATQVNRVLQATILALSTAALAMGGCTKLKQDPFSDKSDLIRNAEPPREKVSPTPIILNSQDAMQIDQDDFYTFQETVKGEIKLSGRVLIPIDGKTPEFGKDFELNIDNLQDFPGATFDKKTGLFAWTPQLGFSEKNYAHKLPMEITLRTKDGHSKSESTLIFVERFFIDPRVDFVDDLTKEPIYENHYYPKTFKVQVFDPDADDSPGGRPQLMITNASSGSNIGSHVSVKSGPFRDILDRTLWNFELQIDLRQAELTKNESTLQFGLISMGRFGKSSAPKMVNVRVRSEMTRPVFSSAFKYSDPKIEFKAGVFNIMTFTAIDPKGEGQIDASVTSCPAKESSATCSCVRDRNDASMAICTVSWTPLEKDIGNLYFAGNAVNNHPIAGAPSVSKNFSAYIDVVANSSPTPKPSPPAK